MRSCTSVLPLVLAGWMGAYGGPAVAEQTSETRPLVDKTLVVWAAPANFAQKGGSALTRVRRSAQEFDPTGWW